MNGVDTLGINIHGDLDTDSPTYKPTFYSYPDDLELIKNQISWILESNGVSTADLNQGKAPYIFPFFGHRFIIIDQNEHVLSMYGNDIIPWEYNLARAIAKDIFKFTNGQNNLSNFQPVKFWLESLDLE